MEIAPDNWLIEPPAERSANCVAQNLLWKGVADVTRGLTGVQGLESWRDHEGALEGWRSSKAMQGMPSSASEWYIAGTLGQALDFYGNAILVNRQIWIVPLAKVKTCS